MNIFRRLFNWIQSGPVDFSYVTGEWGFRNAGKGPRPSETALQQPSILHIPVKLPTQVAAAAAGNGRVAARIAMPVTNGAPTVMATECLGRRLRGDANLRLSDPSLAAGAGRSPVRVGRAATWGVGS